MSDPIVKHHHAIEPEQPQRNRPFADVLEARMTRRSVLRGSLATAAATFFPALGGAVRGTSEAAAGGAVAASVGESVLQLDFEAVAASRADRVLVPDGYSFQVLIPWGTPITGSFPEFDDIGATNSAAEQAQQTGMHHDGMYFFPIDNSSERGLLAINHENITIAYLHPNGPTFDEDGNRTEPDEVRKEMAAHGNSVVELRRESSGQWQVQASGRNRRITPNTLMRLSGPVASSELVQTLFSPDGTQTRGTINNCANGFTPWNTYLTCEENWAGYFFDSRAEDALPREKARYGVGSAFFGYNWHTLAGVSGERNNEFARFDTTPGEGGPTDDFRNESSTYGWIVEIDPFDPSSTPVKRTAMGRFGHEGCWPSPFRAGQQIAFYMGDDSRGEYIYKFVTEEPFDPENPDRDMLDRGILYAARFDEDGTGEWLPLLFGEGPLIAPAFTSQADVLVNTRTAADMLGATPMDRPEWGAVHPGTGEVYMTLTNNSGRGIEGDRRRNQPVDAANPRSYDTPNDADTDPDGNVNGHIVRWRERGGPQATRFTWDIFLFGSRASQPEDINASGLVEENEFSSPDGIWFDPRENRGIVWIETDDSAISDITNNQLLAAIPGNVGDGGPVTLDGQRTFIGQRLGIPRLKRFLVGPIECELTGFDMTPDGRTLFVNIQHPGEDGDASNLTSNFPGGPGTRPRSATLAITKNDGGPMGG